MRQWASSTGLALVAVVHATAFDVRSARAQSIESSPPQSHASSEQPTVLPSMVWVRIHAPAGTLLLKSTGKEWVSVCSTPCDVQVPARYFYRLAGENFETTKAFALKAPGGQREIIEGHAASNAKYTAGVILFVGGMVSGVVGTPIVFLTYGGPVGTVYTFGAETMLAFGLGFMFTNATSTVTQYVMGPDQRAFDLRPEWRFTAVARERAPMASAVGIPILTGVFE